MRAIALSGLPRCNGEVAPADQLGCCFSGSSLYAHPGGEGSCGLLMAPQYKMPTFATPPSPLLSCQGMNLGS